MSQRVPAKTAWDALVRHWPRSEWSRAAGLLTALIAAVALVGWISGRTLLTSWCAGLPTLKPMPALCLVALGLALAGLWPGAVALVRIGRVVAAIAAINLLQDLFGRELGIDRWLAPRGAEPGPGTNSFRMSTAAAIGLLLAGIAPTLARANEARAAAAAVCLIALAGFVLLGFTVNAEAFLSLAPFTSMSLPATFALLALGAGLLVRYRTGIAPYARWPLPARLATVVLAVAAPLMLLVLAVIGYQYTAVLEMQRTSLLYSARSLAAAVDAQLGRWIALGEALARSPAALEPEFTAFDAEARRAFASTADAWVLLADFGGQQIYHRLRQPGQALPRRNPVVLPFQRQAADSGRPVVSGVLEGALVKEWITNIEVPIYKDGKPFRVLVVTARPRAFFDLLNAQNVPEGWLLGIIDRDGRRIARVPRNDETIGQLASQGWLKHRTQEGVFEFPSIEGNLTVVALALSKLSGWSIGVAVNKAEVQAAAWRSIRWALVFGGLVATLSLALAAAIARQISQPVARLQLASSRIAAGVAADIGPAPPEIADLGQALAEGARRHQTAEARLAAIVTSSADPILSKMLDGTITSWNAAAERLFGYSAAEMIGQSIRKLIPADRRTEADMIQTCITSGERLDGFETVRVTRDGRLLDVVITVSPLQDAAGHIVGASKILRDITERKRAEQALAKLTQQLQALLTSAPLGIAYFDHQHRYLQINDDLAAINGIPAPDHIGRTIEQLLPVNARTIGPVIDRIFADGTALADLEVAGETPREPGVLRHWLTGFFPVLGSDGKVEQVGAWVAEITERKKAEAALRDSEAQLQQALSASSAGVWSFNARTNTSTWDDRYQAMYGFAASEPRSFEAWLGRIDPLDRGPILNRLEQMRSDPGDNEWREEFRIHHPTLGKRWMQGMGRCVRDDDGAIITIAGINIDITERKLAINAIAVAEERSRIAQQAARAMNYEVVPATGEVMREPSAFETLTGYGHEAVPATATWWRSIVHPDDVDRTWTAIEKSIAASGGFSLDYRIRHGDGHWVWLHDHAGVLHGRDGSPDRVVGMVFDISEQKAREERIQLLMNEVNHRSKNMLSLVQAIARHTAAGSPQDFVKRFAERVQALSASQDLLVRNEWQGVALYDLTRAQLAHFDDLIDTRVTIAGPPLRLNPAAAQAIGMALHELATNAGKYGALSEGKGCVDINWSVEPGTTDRAATFVISWVERDGPLVVEPQRTGFGSRVISTMARMSVRGEVSFDYRLDGVRWQLSCAADEALDRGKGIKVGGGGGNREH